MTPKEKGAELFFKMFNNGVSFLEAKKCTLIAIDELINCTPSVDIYPFNFQKIQPKVREYWKEVKQAIELL